MKSVRSMRGMRVCNKKRKRVGKVGETLFAPGKSRVVGFIVNRPDFLLMIKRAPRFLALDGFCEDEGILYELPQIEAWDSPALKRLGLTLDSCYIWRGMPVYNEKNLEVGSVRDVFYEQETGEVKAFRLADGSLAIALMGTKDVPASMIIECSSKGLIVHAEAVAVAATGGLADSAGKASAVAVKQVKDAAAATKSAATEVTEVVKGHTKGMFSAFADEFKKAQSGEDDAED